MVQAYTMYIAKVNFDTPHIVGTPTMPVMQ